MGGFFKTEKVFGAEKFFESGTAKVRNRAHGKDFEAGVFENVLYVLGVIVKKASFTEVS